MKIIDISPEVCEKTAVYPGDCQFSREVSFDIRSGDHLGLSSIRTTLHIGAHADAPIHYHGDGVGIGECSLVPYFGPCEVIHAQAGPGERLGVDAIKGVEIAASRVLFATNSFLDRDKWSSDYNSLSPELIQALSEKGVILVGIDTPSVDPDASKKLESHQALFATKMAVLEGIVLEGVEEGLYTLSALPLKITGADASPVRAVLIKDL